MKRNVSFKRIYPHPPEKVWRAIATSEALAEWLMPNDFKAEVGHEFQFHCDPQPGFDGTVHCKILEVDEPHRLSYSWRGGPIDTVVVYELHPVEGGTQLVFRHYGFVGIKAMLVSFILGAGWKKMARTTLPAVLDRIDEAGNLQPATGPMPDASCRSRGVQHG